ncbi:MAG: site-specific integrase [Myxococcales bacterium]|nr:site-specific integrase [Myxococcales bacterium]
MIDIQIEMPDGTITRVRKVSPVQTKRAAEQYEREIRAMLVARVFGKEEPKKRRERRNKEAKEKAVPRFAGFAATFIDTYAKTNNRPSTVREKRRALRRGMLEHIGHLRLDQITARHVEGYKARRKSDGVGPKTINEELAILSKILGYAEEIGELTTPPPKIRRLKVPPSTFDFLDFDEAERLVKAAARAPDPWCAMVPVALWSGLRLGELRGLRWDDVDLVAARLHVRQAADDRNELHPPKSGRARVVDLPKRAVAVLREHRHRRGPFVFCREDGSILGQGLCGKKREGGPLVSICGTAGLRRIGWHALRHTYASHLVMRGATLMEVRELLGHSSLDMTMRYAHLSPTARKAAVALLDEGAE